MTQQDLGLNLSMRRTRKAVSLDEMNLVVPWTELLSLIAPHAPRAKTGRPPFELVTMLRIHFLQQWFGLSDLAMEEALFETTLYREFAGLSSVERIPDRVSILRFRHLLEQHQLAPQILAVVNRYSVPAPYANRPVSLPVAPGQCAWRRDQLRGSPRNPCLRQQAPIARRESAAPIRVRSQHA
jgi:hypothetical protein